MIAAPISPWYRSKDSEVEGRPLVDGLDRLKVVLVTPHCLHQHQVVLLRHHHDQSPEVWERPLQA
jgi:hypothetical protein